LLGFTNFTICIKFSLLISESSTNEGWEFELDDEANDMLDSETPNVSFFSDQSL